MKNISKIGLSLLIALTFIVPTGAIMARSNEETSQAGLATMGGFEIDGLEFFPSSDVIEQVPNVFVTNGYFEPQDASGDPTGQDPILVSPGVMVPNEDCYGIIVGLNGLGCVVPMVDIYKVTSGEHVIMYETSFEDNFDIYNNWVQIDADCGLIGGHYDSFSWSDARASDGDHSMKSTMYDIYKGNQDDYLECTKTFDVSGQNAWLIDFDIWVEGQEGGSPWAAGGKSMYSPVDYLSFEIADHIDDWYNPDSIYNGLAMDQRSHVDECGVTIIDQKADLQRFAGMAEDTYLVEGQIYPGGAYYFFDTSIDPYMPSNWEPYRNYSVKVEEIGAGWWHVWYYVPVPDLIAFGFDITQMRFRFDWHTDPEFQYEGAYVDNIIVTSIENVEEKIFQTAAQQCVDVQGAETFFKFPLSWCDFEDGDYKLQLSTDEYLTDTPPYPKLVRYFKVGSLTDGTITSITLEDDNTGAVIPPGSVINEGTDVHVKFSYHNKGTIPAEDIPVTLTVNKVINEKVYSTDFESLVWTEQQAYPNADWHKTDLDSWTGTYSMAYFNKDNKFYRNADYFGTYGICNVLCPKKINMKDVTEAWFDFYWQAILADSGDNVRLCIADPASGYTVGMSSSYFMKTGPFFMPDWVGPDQNYGMYTRVNLKAAYDQLCNLGCFRYADGTQEYDMSVGFRFTANYSGFVNRNAEAMGVYWSGFMIDDASFTVRKIGDVAFTDTVIIPGPIAPCGVVSNMQFEWENVPYSQYQIKVDVNDPADPCPLNDYKTADVFVFDQCERGYKLTSVDLTENGIGEWGISSSDTDNYLCSNWDTEIYPEGADAYALLKPVKTFDEAKWWNEPLTTQNCPIADDGSIIKESIYVGHLTNLHITASIWHDLEYGWDWVDLEYADVNPVVGEDPRYPGNQFTDWDDIAWFTGESRYEPTADEDGWYTIDINWPIPAGLQWINLRWHLTTDATAFRGFRVDWMQIDDLLDVSTLVDPVHYVDFFDEMDDMTNWVAGNGPGLGSNWHEYTTETLNGCSPVYGAFNDAGGRAWEAFPYNDALVWSTKLSDAYEARLTFYTNYVFGVDAHNTVGYVEVSGDGGANWNILRMYTGTSTGKAEVIDISFLAGKEVLVRFRVDGLHAAQSAGSLFNPGTWGATAASWNISCIAIACKLDTTAPVTTITMTGTMTDAGWYSTPVSVKLTATDDNGVKEVHYILDGKETVVAGSSASFTVSGNGAHNIEYWSVDLTGNVETHKTVPTFRIDSGAPPSVSITAPTPGLYLFGNRLLSLSKVFIIGAFTVEATASDAESGVYRVQFLLDGDVISEDTTAPFSAYVAAKHMGSGVLKVVAEDFSGNTAEDTLDITYYKFL